MYSLCICLPLSCSKDSTLQKLGPVCEVAQAPAILLMIFFLHYYQRIQETFIAKTLHTIAKICLDQAEELYASKAKFLEHKIRIKT